MSGIHFPRSVRVFALAASAMLAACQSAAPGPTPPPRATPPSVAASPAAAPVAGSPPAGPPGVAIAPAAPPAASPAASPGPGAGAQAAAPAAGDLGGGTIKIVSSLPRIGASKPGTDAAVNAIRMALEDVASRVDGAAIEYEDWDDASPERGTWDPLREAENANRAARDPDVMVYIGPGNSGAARVSVPILCAAGVVMISTSVTSPGLTKAGLGAPNEPDIYYPNGCKRNFARVIASDEIQGAGAAWWSEGLGASKAYILDDGSAYGRALGTLYRGAADPRSLQVLAGPESIDLEAGDYAAVAQRVRDSGADIVFYGGTNPNNKAGQLWQDLRATLGPDVKLMGPDGIYNPAFLSGAGAAAEGTYVTLPGVPPSKLSGKGADWYQRYKNRFGSEPESFAANAAEAIQVALRAIRHAGAKDRAAIRDAVFATRDYDGLLGTWSFEPTGDISLRDMSGIRVSGGRFDTANAEPFPAPLETAGRWQGPLQELDAVWDRDWLRSVELLEAFRTRYPYYSPAKNKLYAARVSYGQALVARRQCEAGADQLRQAEALNREQGLGRREAAGALQRGC